MLEWKPACGALLLLVVAVHAQKESDQDVTDDIPAPHPSIEGTPQERQGPPPSIEGIPQERQGPPPAIEGIPQERHGKGKECGSLKDMPGSCGNMKPCFCDDNKVCLAGGTKCNEGNVFVDGKPVCDDFWRDAMGSYAMQNAGVICRELGFARAAKFTTQSSFGKVPWDFGMDDLKCTGNEKKVRECPHTRHDNCGSYEGAGVICEG